MNFKPLPIDIEEAICVSYRAGNSEDKVASKQGVTRDVVRRVLNRHNVERRRRGEGLRALSKEQEENIFTRYMAGEGRYPLADEFGVHESTIRQVLKVRGVSARRETPIGLALTKIPEVAPVYAPSVEGKVCSKCKVYKLAAEFYPRPERPIGIQSTCKECAKEKARAVWDADPEKVRARQRELYAADIEHRRAYARNNMKRRREAGLTQLYKRRYRMDNPEVHKRAHRRAYLRHRERILERSRQWQQENWTVRQAYIKAWLKTPSGRHSACKRAHKRREVERRCKAPLTFKEWQGIVEQQNNECACCRSQFSDKLPPTRDHIVPVTKGGMLTLGNVQALCRPCNTRKGTKIIDYRKGY